MLYRVVLALALLAAGPALAQSVPAPAPAPASPAAPGAPEAPPAARSGHSRARLKQLHDQIGITAAQQPQWDAVVAAFRQNAHALRADPSFQTGRAAPGNGIAVLHTASDRLRARAAAIDRLIPPMEALYASLSPEQQHMADQALAQSMHVGKGRGRHRSASGRPALP